MAWLIVDRYLTGNPCTKFEGYRDYVLATIPTLKMLDGTATSKTERILGGLLWEAPVVDSVQANQALPNIIESLRAEAAEYKASREQSKEDKDGDWYNDPNGHLTLDDMDLDEATKYRQQLLFLGPHMSQKILGRRV